MTEKKGVSKMEGVLETRTEIHDGKEVIVTRYAPGHSSETGENWLIKSRKGLLHRRFARVEKPEVLQTEENLSESELAQLLGEDRRLVAPEGFGPDE
jgi:hypothetical protein